jgi:hypothetical protein
MSTPDQEPDARPSKDEPLSYAPKKVRHAEQEPNPAGAPATDDVAPLHEVPEPAEYPWNQSDQRQAFAGDVAMRGKHAFSPGRFRELSPPSTSGKYLLAGWLAGVATVTAVGFMSYRLGAALPPSSLPPALPASQSHQQTDAPQSAEAALSAAKNAIVLPSNEQKSPDIASPRTVSQQLTVGAVRPLLADEAAMLIVSAKDAGPKAAVVISGLAAGCVIVWHAAWAEHVATID